MTWRLANALVQLRAELDAKFPNRDKSYDGTVSGDGESDLATSDHNPWIKDENGVGVVRAFDFTAGGMPAPDLAEFIFQKGKNGDTRLTDNGCIIYNSKISSSDWSQWIDYTGSNSYNNYVHVSLSRNQLGYDSQDTWGIAPVESVVPVEVIPDPVPAYVEPVPVLSEPVPVYVEPVPLYVPATVSTITVQWGNSGPVVSEVQTALNNAGYYCTVNGEFGPETDAALRKFQQDNGLVADGFAGPKTRVELNERKV